jgi:S1-C subfamily serine protease
MIHLMIPDNFSTLAEQVGPAVVNVQVEKTTKGEAGMHPFQGNPYLEVNRQSVSSAGELKQLLAKHKGGDGISLLVQRINAGMVVLKMA